jgi:hypothetical protein
MVGVLVDERVRGARIAAVRDDDQAAPAASSVAACSVGSAVVRKLAARHDADRHAADLVAVSGAAKQIGVPLYVHIRGADIECDRPAVAILDDDGLRPGGVAAIPVTAVRARRIRSRRTSRRS